MAKLSLLRPTVALARAPAFFNFQFGRHEWLTTYRSWLFSHAGSSNNALRHGQVWSILTTLRNAGHAWSLVSRGRHLFAIALRGGGPYH
jgi:hypothetical protein